MKPLLCLAAIVVLATFPARADSSSNAPILLGAKENFCSKFIASERGINFVTKASMESYIVGYISGNITAINIGRHLVGNNNDQIGHSLSKGAQDNFDLIVNYSRAFCIENPNASVFGITDKFLRHLMNDEL